MITANEIHERLADRWPQVLQELGIAAEFLKNREGPCPVCGGTKRYRFDNKYGRGDSICNVCRHLDGFDLLMRVHGWTLRQAIAEVASIAGIVDSGPTRTPHSVRPIAPIERAEPPSSVWGIRTSSCRVEDCEPVRLYLEHRGLWPLPRGHGLRAHASLQYKDEDRKLIGRYPALVADVVDADGELVAIHRTYLERTGRKLGGHEPRKLLGKLTGREGCAVRLARLDGDVLGIGEGIETSLSAARIHGIPTWSALNAGLLEKFTPPENVRTLVIFADRDNNGRGLEAAARLIERLHGRVQVELRLPKMPFKDFNDQLTKEITK